MFCMNRLGCDIEAEVITEAEDDSGTAQITNEVLTAIFMWCQLKRCEDHDRAIMTEHGYTDMSYR
jgi:hypothetical protein